MASMTDASEVGLDGEKFKWTYRNTFGNLCLSPKIMGLILNRECQDKKSHETYRQYLDRLRRDKNEDAFSNTEWKKAFGFLSKAFETVTNPDEQDVTAIFSLFNYIITIVRKDSSKDYRELLKKLKEVKDWRNNSFHNLQAVESKQNFEGLRAALVELIDEAGSFYSLNQGEIEDMKHELSDDIAKLQSTDKTSLYYWCSRLMVSGKAAFRLLWESRLSGEVLSLGNETIKVKRRDVFHALDLEVKALSGGEVFPYFKIFGAPEKIVVVTGVAGAGKTTLVKNIVLQFFEPLPKADDFLKSFNQVIFFECRDRTTTTLSDVIEQHFEDLCIELGKENILKALLRLDVLIIVDGFDEVNDVSKKVVIEVIEKTRRNNCRVLITARPYAVKEKLEPLLTSHDVSFTQFEIMPLTELDDQLEFLRRYEESLSDGTPTGEMTRSFMCLNNDIRSQFSEPINLVHFCEMHKYFPEAIPSWQTPGDVAPDKLRLYRKLLHTKLSGSIDEDLDVLVDNMFALVGAEALKLLRDNVLTFSEAELRAIKPRCQVRLKGDEKSDSAVVLSIVLKEHKPLGLNRSSSYEFKHKSEQEMFAGDYVVQCIIGESADSLNNILGVPKEELSQLREVLLYVVQMLSRDSPRHFLRRCGELKEALRDAGVTAADVMDCVTRCPDHAEQVAELATLTEDEDWNVRNIRHVSAVTKMLRHSRPKHLVVEMEAAALRKAQWGELLAEAGGVDVRLNLFHPYDYQPPYYTYQPHDDLLLPLPNSGVRLVGFWGCVGTPAGVAALAAVARGAELHIRMAAPLDLGTFGGINRKLTVYTRPFSPPAYIKRPLPLIPSPSLYVEGADSGCRGAVAHTITSLAPHNKRFAELRLKGCRLRAAEQQLLLQELQAAGIRTNYWGDTRAEAFG
ncbi:uncharacterized protein LOC108676794 [Hyalella azteca]|uniref:Uncharacterized protein LOC108676794 n=1 Tax=Hyalella azteca TaxID=294128 RepID=A0A979FQB7_HYAAZ|nr:uncharacterized protein LOC108676794 [Hyalella azteca]